MRKNADLDVFATAVECVIDEPFTETNESSGQSSEEVKSSDKFVDDTVEESGEASSGTRLVKGLLPEDDKDLLYTKAAFRDQPLCSVISYKLGEDPV